MSNFKGDRDIHSFGSGWYGYPDGAAVQVPDLERKRRIKWKSILKLIWRSSCLAHRTSSRQVPVNGIVIAMAIVFVRMNAALIALVMVIAAMIAMPIAIPISDDCPPAAQELLL